jgi:hypothetical protein
LAVSTGAIAATRVSLSDCQPDARRRLISSEDFLRLAQIVAGI